MAEEGVLLAEAAKLPIDERVAHSNWKVRSAAYEYIKASCKSVFDPSDPCLADFASVFGKASADGNAAALDKALEALQAFLEKASDAAAGRIAGTVSSNIVSKALGARPSTVIKGIDCLMAFAEVEQAEKVTTSLVEGYGQKVPKVVVGALDATLQLVRAFGGRVMPAQQILKAMAPMFESKDAKARGVVKEIVAELARWMGPELIRAALYDKLRDAQKDDVEKLLQEAPAGRPKPERQTRKEAAKAAAAASISHAIACDGDEGTAATGVAVAVQEEPEQVDSYEFAEPKDIIPELKKDFWEGVENPKWSERKAALTTLKELAAYPRLANGDFGDVNREIKKIISKDSNIQVVAEAMNCVANIAKGLRKDYRGAAMTLCPVMLEKFKDKAAVVGKAAAEALDSVAKYSFSLPDVAEDVAAALSHQNPKVKESTLNWLAGCTPRETKANVVKLVPGVIVAAAKCTDEGAPAIREAAFNFLVQAALKAGSLSALDKGLAKMDEAKRKKLEDMVMEAAKARRLGAAAPAAAAPPALSRGSSSRTLRPASGGPSPVTSPRPSTSGPAARPAAAASRSTSIRSSNSRPPTGTGRPKPAGVAASSANGAAGGGGAPGGGDAAVEDENALSSGLMNATEAKMKLIDLFGEELVTQLGDAQWKVRLEAMETVVAKAQSPEAAESAAVLAQCVAHVPGWDEKNFQVMARQFEVIRCCAEHPGFGKREALVAVIGGTDKLADLKLKEAVFQMLLAASEAVGPQLVASLLHKRAAAHKNPKVLTEAINWINLAVQDFLLPAFNVKSLIDWAKDDLGSANAATRTAAIQLLGCLHTFLGPPLADMVRPDLKPALMATVEAEFAKQPQQTGFSAKRVSRAAAAGKPAAGGVRKGKGGAAAAAAATEEPASMDDLLPRADISGQITSELVAKLGSANWKERKEGLDEVESILAAAGGRIQPCVGDLMPALKGRMADSNKNLVAQALSLLGKLAKAMGRAIVREARPVLGPAVKCICDSKNTVRAAVIEMLEAWASVAPADTAFEELLDILPSPKCVSEGMQAGIAWMASVYAAGKGTSHDCVVSAVKAFAIGASYKTVPVREAAGQLLEAMVATVGLQSVQSAVQGLDKNLQKAAAEALSKSGVAAGAGPAATAAASSRPGTAGSAAASSSSRPPSRAGTASVRASTVGGAGPRPGTAASAPGRSIGGVGSSSSLNRSTAAGSAAGLAAAVGVDEGPLLSMDRGKEERARKARFKSSKFEIRPEELQTLEQELGVLASPGLRANLFAKDFKKQVLAADAIKNWINSRQDEQTYDVCVACLDLLLRWCVVRLAEGNTQTLVGVTGMLKALFDLLAEQGYRLSEAEVKVYVPGLVEKCGQPTPQMKAECRDLIRRVSTMYPAVKVISFIQEGLNSKNNRTRVTCAEEIGYLVDKEGPRVYSGAKCDVLAALAKLVAEPGKEIRAAALEALGVVYTFEGEAIWKRLGNLNGQQKGILEERLKTMDKDLAKRGLAAGYRRAELDAMRSSTDLDTSSSLAGGLDTGTYGPGSTASVGYAAVPAAAAGGSYGSLRPRGDKSILAGVGSISGGAGAYSCSSNSSTLGGYGAASASGVNSSQSAIPGLSSSAGMISLNAAAAAAATGATPAAADMATPGRMSRQQSNLIPAAAGSMSGLTMTGAGQAAVMQPVAHSAAAQQQQAYEAAAAARPSVATGLHLQPLQSFTNPQDLQAEFAKCIDVLQHGHVDDVIEVMKLLCYEMMDLQRNQAAAAAGAAGAGSPQGEAVWQLLVKQADMLVQLLTMQTQLVFVAASNCMRTGQLPAGNCRACKYALNTLMNIFGNSALPASLQPETLAALVRVLLMRLVDDNLGRQPEGEALLKALNVLMLKILENSNRNYTFSALLGLLLDVPTELGAAPVGDAAYQSQLAVRWADLVVKCLIKSTKALPQVIQTIDLRSLLLSIHAFFEALGVDEIRRRSHADDKPLRMVKTILHELCKLKGTDIYRYTADIPQHGSTSGADGKPVIFPYIDLNIQTLQGNGTIRPNMGQPAAAGAAAPTPAAGAVGSSSNSSMNPATPGRSLLQAATAVRAPQTPGSTLRTGGIVAQLSAVFTRLSAHMQASSKDSSEKRAVLLDIYNISQEQGMPIDKLMAMYLPDTTPAFKSWIVAELRKIDEEQQQGQQQQPAPAATQQQQQPSTMESAAPGALGSVYSNGSAAAAACGTGGPTMEALKARMNQLQSEKTRMLHSSPVKSAAAPPAAAASIVTEPAIGIGTGVEGPAGGMRNLQDLRSRMRGLTGL